MGKTKIEWTDRTWNPVTGCSKISAGCANCYAERMAKRLHGRHGYDDKDPFKITLHGNRFLQPLDWKKPSMIFVCSMGDLFHDDVPSDTIQEIFQIAVHASTKYGHIFMFLTKRAMRMKRETNFFANRMFPDTRMMIRDIWMGVTAEDNQQAYNRIPHLVETQAITKFVSVEPMLEAVQVHPWLMKSCKGGIDWVICGCESGPGHRQTHHAWVENLLDQCRNNLTPFFLKQLYAFGQFEKMPLFMGKKWDQYPYYWEKTRRNHGTNKRSETSIL